MKSRSIKMQPKNKAKYPAILTKQALSIKDILYGQMITPKNFAFCGNKAGNPEWDS